MEKQKKQDEILYAKLNLETAQMSWKDLERFYASGALIFVERELDLVEVAVRVANDEKKAVEDWLKAGRIFKVTDAQALAWHEQDASLWTVVVKPWILVQEQGNVADSLH
ncbi:MAG: DUF2288 domain-containing protein [Oxalobacter sp.]|nr:MAG: DUF2288 domain-containing protein [Oxalobacter sp.]